MDAGEGSRSVQHLIDLGYEDPHDAAAHRHALEQRQDAGRRAAEALLAEGRTADAIDALTQLAGEAPQWPVPRRLLAHTCYAAGRFDDARTHLDWLNFHGIETASLALLRAAVEFAGRRLDAALDQATYALHLDAQIVGAEALIGDVYYRRGRLDDAEAAYRAELSRRPTSAAALAGMAALCLRREDYAGAVDRGLAALAQDFQRAAVHYRMGVALARLGRMSESVTALETAAKLRPDFAAPLRLLAQIAQEHLRDAARATEYARQASERLRSARAKRKRRRSLPG